jgi:hypothetical protein
MKWNFKENGVLGCEVSPRSSGPFLVVDFDVNGLEFSGYITKMSVNYSAHRIERHILFCSSKSGNTMND